MAPVSWFFIFMGATFLLQWAVIIYLLVRNNNYTTPSLKRAGARPARVTPRTGEVSGPAHIDIGGVKPSIGNVDGSKVKSETSTINTNSDRLKKLKELKEGKK